MKLKQLFMGMLMAVALAACSSDSPADNGSEPDEIGQGENYISVAIEMPASAGSRTTEGSFDDGTKNESDVTNIVFFFFDDAGNCVEVQKIDNPSFKDPALSSTNPNITNYGTIEVRLKAGLKYNKVAVALNSPAQNATDLKSEIASISDLLARTYNYAAYVNKTPGTNVGKGQVMSNSVYYDMKNSDGSPDGTHEPTADKKVDVIPITDKNIYTSAQRANIEDLITAGTKEYVNIFVERVLAKVDVSEAVFDMGEYYIVEEGGIKKTTMTLFDHVNGTSREITVQPYVKGTILNVLAPKTALVKPLNIVEVGYGKGDGQYKGFQWNDPKNKRSYWASTALFDESDMHYFSWKDAVDRGRGELTDYIHPNTQDYKPVAANERRSLNTKVMVVAKLCEVENGVLNPDKPLDLVMFGADYMLKSAFLPYVASLVNRDIRNIDWDTADLGDISLTQDQMTTLKTAVNNAFLNENGYNKDNFSLGIAGEPTGENEFGDEDWAAEVNYSGNFTLTLTEVSNMGIDGLFNKVSGLITNTRNATMNRLNESRILYWNEGCTYYYTNICHQGFDGLAGNATTDFLYGVVRNHWYQIELKGIYGLGTPVIKPDKPINPDRPNDERPSYIKAKINILPWRVVKNEATIH